MKFSDLKVGQRFYAYRFSTEEILEKIEPMGRINAKIINTDDLQYQWQSIRGNTAVFPVLEETQIK